MQPKNYKILTLGASGAGKTVFLASMFKALSIQSNNSFRLKVEDQRQRKLLNSIYTQIITGDTWPSGTINVSEWTFTCNVQTDTLDSYNACQFTYFDYAGGLLTDLDNPSELDAIVNQADAILSLLDGQKIEAWLSGGDQSMVNTFLKKDLPSILRYIEGSKIPIHFIISKWDILDNKKISLNQVRDRLLSIPKFEQLVRNRNNIDSPVRLIAVSSVGLNFAIPAPDGSMKKNPGAVPCPFQVEAPIACVLPDRIQQLYQESKRKQEILQSEGEKVNKQAFLGEVLDFLGIGLDGMGFLLELAEDFQDVKFIRPISFVVTILNKIVKTPKKSQENARQRAESLKNVEDEQTALKHVISNCIEIQDDLLKLFPQSELFVL